MIRIEIDESELRQRIVKILDCTSRVIGDNYRFVSEEGPWDDKKLIEYAMEIIKGVEK